MLLISPSTILSREQGLFHEGIPPKNFCLPGGFLTLPPFPTQKGRELYLPSERAFFFLNSHGVPLLSRPLTFRRTNLSFLSGTLLF